MQTSIVKLAGMATLDAIVSVSLIPLSGLIASLVGFRDWMTGLVFVPSVTYLWWRGGLSGKKVIHLIAMFTVLGTWFYVIERLLPEPQFPEFAPEQWLAKFIPPLVVGVAWGLLANDSVRRQRRAKP